MAGIMQRAIKKVAKLPSSILGWFMINVFALFGLTIFDIYAPTSIAMQWWPKAYNLSLSLLSGSLTSFLIYFLIVHLPEQRKRRVIKDNLRKTYSEIKENIMYQIIFASQKGGRSDLLADSDTVKRLLTIDGFKSAFRGGSDSHEGFYAFRNYIDSEAEVSEYREIIVNLKALSQRIDFVLHNYNIDDKEIFDFLTRLQIFLLRLEYIGPGYEEEKVLSKFIWEIFAGWDIIGGYRSYDIVEKMIEDI